MNTFVRSVLDSTDTSVTKNGCKTFSTSLSANLDFFALASGKRDKYKEAIELFRHAFEEDRNLALKNLFYLRDVREGQGERNLFRSLFKTLLPLFPSKELLKLIPEYGRWDDLISLYSCYGINTNRFIEEIIKEQFKEDAKNMQEGKSISLLAKWYPLANSVKNPERKAIGEKLTANLFTSEKNARKFIVKLRKHIDLVEQKLSEKKYSEIEYSKVPSKASLKYKKSFAKNDSERYAKYIESVLEGKVKINASVTYPYEIVAQLNGTYNKQTMDTLEALWKNLPDYTNGLSSICVVDTSGSMCVGNPRAIDVALSLGIYFAERNNSVFKNAFMTFSESPKMQYLKGDTLEEKVRNLATAKWGMSTNIEKTFDCIIEAVKKNNLKQIDVPDQIVIISDMEFNECGRFSGFEMIDNNFSSIGFKRPDLVFWNVNSRGTNIPVRKDENGVILVSGCSPTIFKQFMLGTTPENFMNEVLNSERYSNITWEN